jgi:inner membrane protein
MPTIMTHVAVPLALGIGMGKTVISPRLLVAGMAASVLPDLDVISFHLGVSYGAAFGHRGFTHAIPFAVAMALLGAYAWRTLQTRWITAFWFLFVTMASHGALDAFTDGGQGIAFWWPFSDERYFLPFQVIEVSPIGVERFLSQRGAIVLISEIKWVWLPSIALAACLMALRVTRTRLRHKPM